MGPVAYASGSLPITVVKVGGSLFGLPDLGPRLQSWLAANGRRSSDSESRVVLVPGGGPLTDVIRTLDHRHRLGEEASHWLALRTLTVNAYFLASLVPGTCVHSDVGSFGRVWDNNLLPILDVHEFARDDERRPGRLPHSWAVTSDALAARVAVVLQARNLVLLKSTTIPSDMDWAEAGRLGLVDALFAEVLRQAPAELCVRAVNLTNEPKA